MSATHLFSEKYNDVLSACVGMAKHPKLLEDGTVAIVHGSDVTGYRTNVFSVSNRPAYPVLRRFAEDIIELEHIGEAAGYMMVVDGKRHFGENPHHGVSSVIVERMKVLLGKPGRK